MSTPEHESEDSLTTTDGSISRETDFAEWLSALQEYVKKTQVISLDTSWTNLYTREIQEVLKIVADSEITNLNLSGISLDFEVLRLLTSTKIQELDIAGCNISADCFIQFLNILKDTRIRRLLAIKGYFCGFEKTLSDNDARELAQNLAECRIETLQFNNISGVFPREAMHNLIRGTLFITGIFEKHVTSLLSCLDETSILSLSLKHSRISDKDIHILNKILTANSLESLQLDNNSLSGVGQEILSEGLKHSRLSHLEISGNNLSDASHLACILKSCEIKYLDIHGNQQISERGWTRFTQCIKDTSLNILLLRGCRLQDKEGEQLFDGLKGSKVTKLDVSLNEFWSRTSLAFSRALKDTSLTEVNYFENWLPVDTLSILGDSLVNSKLESISVTVNTDEEKDHDVGECFSSFINKTSASKLTSLKINLRGKNVKKLVTGVEKLTENLGNSIFTHLDLSSTVLKYAAMCLSESLRLSAITHLNLSDTHLKEEGAEILAKYLQHTQIVDLDLSANFIRNRGAKALARNLRNSKLISLNLLYNRIEIDGLIFLATHVENTFITTLKVNNCNGGRCLGVDRALLRNRVVVHGLVNFFKLIQPESKTETFHFDRGSNHDNISEFLGECLKFYKTVTEQPSAISVLSQEKSHTFSRDELESLLLEDFPRLFAEFISTRVEADVAEHVEFLARAEDMGLSKIVENLLLCRPIYIIDNENEILHPFIYKLFLKHKLPVCNLDVEPNGLKKIVKFFTENSEIEGASETVNLLTGTGSAHAL